MAKDRKIDMAILGLLSHEDMTGYDIKKRIDNHLRFFWKGSFGSIYPALAEMEKEDLIRKTIPKRQPAVKAGEVAFGSGRERIVYKITATGREALSTWLTDTKASNDLRYETLLKIFFGGAADRETAIANISVFEEQVRSDLMLLKLYHSDLEKHLDNDDHLYFYLTVSFGIDTYEAYLRWCKNAKEKLAG